MELSVGIIGVNAHRGWARESHVPAVHAVPGVRLAGVASRDRATSHEAADVLGAARAYDTGQDLLADPDIDVVVATVPVPAHAEVVSEAMRRGKHVVTEWPLTPSTAASEELAAAAQARAQARASSPAGTSGALHAVVGLQARTSPAVLHAVDLLRAGTLGRVLSISATSTTAGFGGQVAPHDAYLEDPAAGMHLLTIQGAHTLDLVCHLATASAPGRQGSTRPSQAPAASAGLASMSALLSVVHPRPTWQETTLERTLPDHVAVHGRFDGGVPFIVEVAGGRPAHDTPFRLDVTTEAGVLGLAGGAPRGFQSGVLTLHLDGQQVALDLPRWQQALPDSAVNVAGLYAALVADVSGAGGGAGAGAGGNGGARPTPAVTTPTFQDAAQLARLIDQVRTAGGTPGRVAPSPQPATAP